MPYPKKKDKKNLNLSAHGGEADVDIATKDYPTKKNDHVQKSFWNMAKEKNYQEEIMPQPIMKKYKHGEMGAAYPKSANEKLDGSIMKKYKQGEFSGAGGKAPKEKLASWSKEKIKHGSFNS